jgi:hypothetical protein
MHDILRRFVFCFTYIDDILLYYGSPEELDRHLRILFRQLQVYDILLSPAKVFGAAEVTLIGYRISHKASQPMPKRVADLQGCPPPQTIRNFRRFLGMLNFDRRFLPHAAATQAPLYALLAGPRTKGSQPID